MIGYSDEGTFGDNPALGWFFDRLMTLHFVLLLRVIRLSLQVASRVLEHLVTTNGPGAPFDSQCPQVNGKNCWVGCGRYGYDTGYVSISGIHPVASRCQLLYSVQAMRNVLLCWYRRTYVDGDVACLFG